MDDKVAAALKRVPQLSGLAPDAMTCVRLGGLTNLVYRVEAGPDRYVLRIPGAGTEDFPPGFSLVEEPSVGDPSATLPSIKAAQASVEDYFDGTRSISMSLDKMEVEPEPSGEATATGERDARRYGSSWTGD